MRLTSVLFVTVVALVFAAMPALAQTPFPSDSSLQGVLQDLVASGRTVRIVVGLLDGDGGRRVISSGSPGSTRLPLDGHTTMDTYAT